MRIVKLAIVAVLALGGTSARAEWLKATSRHFQIYSDTSPESIRLLATRLEQVDSGLRLISGVKDTAESAANPVTVFVLESVSAINRLSGSSSIAGFYVGRASGAVAFTPRRAVPGQLDPQLVLFHEYAHHFLLQQSSIAYPAWLSEGYAEFVGTALFTDDSVTIGAAAKHRAYGLIAASKLPITTLFQPGPRLTSLQTDQIYGRGWLLTHYLLFGGQRRKQIESYLVALNSGMPPLAAAEKAFGDLKTLDRELDAYLRRKTLTAAVIPFDKLPAPTINVRSLTPGERALVPMRIISTRGVDQATAAPLYARAARAAVPFPADVVAQGWLAELAFDAGNDAAAEQAADRALAADPRASQALLYKAQVGLRRLAAAKIPASDKAWGQARSWIVKANRADTNAAAPLLLFYDSFEQAGAPPSKSAVLGLHRAQELAPQDDELRFRSARQLLVDGRTEDAKRVLRPLAFSPHASANNPAGRLLAMVEKGSTGPAAIAVLDAEAAITAASVKTKD